jgi:hypothetical protein
MQFHGFFLFDQSTCKSEIYFGNIKHSLLSQILALLAKLFEGYFLCYLVTLFPIF